MPYLITDIQNPLSMQKIDKNDGGLYYQAVTDRFTPFAITDKKASSLMSAAVLIIGLILIVVATAAVFIKAKRKH